MNKKKIIFDISLILLLAVIGFASFLILELLKEDGEYVTVSVNGEQVASYPLDTDGEFSLNGGTNILVIKGGRAYVKYADCPDGLCINQGEISRTGERITCLPNRVMIEVEGDGEEILESK